MQQEPTQTALQEPTWADRDKIIGQPIGKTLLRLAVPAVISTLFTVIFEIIDMFWIGKLGPVSIAALSASSFYVWMLRGLGLVIATGAIALISRRSGEKNAPSVLAVIIDTTAATFLFSLLIIAVFFPIGINVFKWIKLEPTVAAGAVDYGIVFLSGLLFVYMMMSFEFILRGIGDTRTPMIITGIALLLNALLDPVFIFYFHMGLRGAAVATILAQALGALLMAGVIFKKLPALKKMSVNRSLFNMKTFLPRFRELITIGGPIGLSDAGFSMIYLMLSGIISIFGKEPLAAVGIGHRLEALPFFICLGFSMAVAPMVGQYLGAGDPEKARQSVYLSLKITSGILLLTSLFFFLFAPWLFRLFTNDAAIITHGTQYLRIVVLLEVFLAMEVVLGGAFSGAGDTGPPFFIIFPITFLRVPAAYLLAVTAGLGIKAVWWVIGTTTFFKGALLLYWFNKNRWMKKNI